MSPRVLLFVSRVGKRSQSGVFTPQLPDVAETVLTSPSRNWMCTSTLGRFLYGSQEVSPYS